MRVLPVLTLAVRAQEAVSLKMRKGIAMVGLVTMMNDVRDKISGWQVLKFLENQFPNNTKFLYNYDRAPKSKLDAKIFTRCYQNVNSVTNLKSPTPQFKSHLIVDYITVAWNLVQFTSKSHIIGIGKILAFVTSLLLFWP